MSKVRLLARRYALSVTLVLAAAAIGLLVNASLQNSDFTRALATERAQSITDGCEAQNARHKNTLAELDREFSQIGRGSTRSKRAQLNASKEFTVLLIDQLAPYQNCQRVLAKSTSTK